mmetsp:Transcript_15536/g.48607  ORF Transcript_15536/g.48607 Transcript_15536/m.48607 type:complete len:159 (+) Transcript_15536:83-559(+)
MASFHEQELEELIASASKKISAGEDATAQLDEADELVAQLRIDARGKEAKKALAARETTIRDLRNRAALFDGATRPPPSSARNRVDDTLARAQESNRRVEATQELITEIEETGNDIITELGRNRETIQKIDGHVKDTNVELDKADKKVTKMSKWWNRW